MTGLQAICVLIIRLWAIGVILGVMSSLPYYIPGVLLQDADPQFLINAIQSLVWLCLAIGAWFLAPRMSRAISPTAGDQVSISIGATDFVVVGSFLIGGFYLVRYLPDFFASLATISIERLSSSPADTTPPAIDPFMWKDLAAEAMVLVVALFLTFRARDVANMFASLHVAGLSKNVTQNTPQETA